MTFKVSLAISIGILTVLLHPDSLALSTACKSRLSEVKEACQTIPAQRLESRPLLREGSALNIFSLRQRVAEVKDGRSCADKQAYFRAVIELNSLYMTVCEERQSACERACVSDDEDQKRMCQQYVSSIYSLTTQIRNLNEKLRENQRNCVGNQGVKTNDSGPAQATN